MQNDNEARPNGEEPPDDKQPPDVEGSHERSLPEYEDLYTFLCDSQVLGRIGGATRLELLRQAGLERYISEAQLDRGDEVEPYVLKLLSLLYPQPEDLLAFLDLLQSRLGGGGLSGPPPGGPPPGFFEQPLASDAYIRMLLSYGLGTNLPPEFNPQISDLCPEKAESASMPLGGVLNQIPYTYRGLPIVGQLSLLARSAEIVRGPEGSGKTVCRLIQADQLSAVTTPATLVVELRTGELVSLYKPASPPSSESRRLAAQRQERERALELHNKHLKMTVVRQMLGALIEQLRSDPERYTRFYQMVAPEDIEELIDFRALCDASELGSQLDVPPHVASLLDEPAKKEKRFQKHVDFKKLFASPNDLSGELGHTHRIAARAGFDQICILVDWLGEVAGLRELSNTDVLEALGPILAPLVLRPVNGAQVYWKFFLRDDLADAFEERLQASDIPSYRLERWETQLLRRMVSSSINHRLRVFLVTANLDLANLCAQEAIVWLERLFELAQGQPKRCWRLIMSLFTIGHQKATIPLTSSVFEAVIRNAHSL